MGLAHSPRIVTNGLIGCWDAGNTKSYPGSGTTWSDLSGGSLNATLYNSPGFSSNSITFNGSTQYAATGNLPFSGSSAFSVMGWFYRTGSYSAGGCWGVGKTGSLKNISSWNSSSANHIAIDLFGTTTYTTGQTFDLNTWNFAAWTFAGGTFSRANVTMWKNTTSYTGTDLTILRGTETSTPALDNTNGVCFGRVNATDNLYYAPINIANFNLYNRALTSLEVLQNFNALRGRFGL